MILRKRRVQNRSNVDLTPMIDIVFQLILFFLVSTTFAVLPGIKLNLPESKTSEGTNLQGITISAQSDGTMFFNDISVDFDSLSEYLLKFDTGDTKKSEFPISLEADSEVTNGNIVKIFDVVRQTGFSQISLRTKSIN